MKKYGSWTELAALVLRTPDNSATVTIDAANDFAVGNYTFRIPSYAPAGDTDDFTMVTAAQELTSKTLQDAIISRNGGAGGTIQLRPDSGVTGSRVLTVNTNQPNTDLSFLGGGLVLYNTLTVESGSSTLGLTAPQNTVLTAPNTAAGTLVTEDFAQTLTSKTMTDLRYSEQSIASAASVASDGSSILHLTGSPVALTTVTGVSVAGTIKVLENATTGPLNILETGNIVTGTGGALTLEQNTSVTMYYTGSEWRIIGGSGSGAGGLKLQDLDFATWDAATPPIYEAAAGTHYLINSADGAMTIYLPSENQDGDVIRFTDASSSWAIGGTTNLFVAPHSGSQLDGLAVDETLELDIPGSWIQFMWDEGQGKWVSDDPLSPSGLSWLTVEGLSGATPLETDKHYIATGNSPYTVTLPAGSDGYVIRISDSTQNFATNPITVTPNGAEQIDDYAPGESLVLDLKGIWVQFMWDGTQWLTDDPIAPSNIPSISGTTGGFLYSNGGDVTNSETMFLNGSNVGIGLTGPSSNLDVRDGTGSILTVGNSGTFVGGETSTIRFRESTTNLAWLEWNADNNRLDIINNVGTQTAMYLKGGNVGIGTPSPSVLLDIESTVAASTTQARIKNTQTDSTTQYTVVNDASKTVQMRIRGSAVAGNIFGQARGTTSEISSNQALAIGTLGAQNLYLGTNDSTDMTIDSAGNVGIGTTNPLAIDGGASTKFHVRGPITGPGIDNEVARFEDGADADNTYAVVRVTHGNDRGLYLKGGRGTGDQGKGVIGITNSAGTQQPGIFMAQTGIGVAFSGVGIGSPLSPLHVYSNQGSNYVARFEQNSTTGYGVLIETASTDSGDPALAIQANGSTIFFTDSEGNTYVKALRYAPGGTVTPGDEIDLDISGTTLVVITNGRTNIRSLVGGIDGQQVRFILGSSGAVLELQHNNTGGSGVRFLLNTTVALAGSATNGRTWSSYRTVTCTYRGSSNAWFVEET